MRDVRGQTGSKFGVNRMNPWDQSQTYQSWGPKQNSAKEPSYLFHEAFSTDSQLHPSAPTTILLPLKQLAASISE